MTSITSSSTGISAGLSAVIAAAKIDEIYEVVSMHKQQLNSFGFARGYLGVSVFTYLYAVHSGQKKYFDEARRAFDHACDMIDSDFQKTYPNDFAGLGAVSQYLCRTGVLDIDPNVFLSDIDAVLLKKMRSELYNGQLGGLANGALGYGLYFLQRGYYNRSFAQSIVEELVQGIARYAIHTPDGCYWKSGLNHTSPKAGLFSPDETAAVLLFLARIVEMGLCPAERMEGIAQKAVSYIETCRRNTGDIETGYTLLRAGIAFNNAAWARSGREDLRRYAISRQENADLIKDAGIVHGAAGLALLFDRITQIGNDPTIERAADFWYAQILRFGGHPDGYAGYMAAEHPWNLQINLAFCQGIMGIGSTLIRALHPEVHFDDLIWSV